MLISHFAYRHFAVLLYARILDTHLKSPVVTAGMLLERLNGAPVTKRLKHPGFHDVQFVKDMLQSVFKTLEVAQGAIGFHHADFRLANVSLPSISECTRVMYYFVSTHCCTR